MEFASPEPKRRVVLGDLQKDRNGRTVQYIYEPVKDPEFMSTDELRELKPVATVVHASNNDRQNFPDAPPYIVHFPTQSREEREWLLGIVDEEILREFGEG